MKSKDEPLKQILFACCTDHSADPMGTFHSSIFFRLTIQVLSGCWLSVCLHSLTLLIRWWDFSLEFKQYLLTSMKVSVLLEAAKNPREILSDHGPSSDLLSDFVVLSYQPGLNHDTISMQVNSCRNAPQITTSSC